MALATLEKLQNGASVNEIKTFIPKLIEEEKYEFVKGIEIAIEEFERLPI